MPPPVTTFSTDVPSFEATEGTVGEAHCCRDRWASSWITRGTFAYNEHGHSFEVVSLFPSSVRENRLFSS
jgi:hypothetical protein